MRFFAYIDPGTGSFAVQAAIGAVLGASYMVRHHVRHFITKLRRGFKSD